tara:strand:- start:704 stop:1027 length:324 start_codon:yes stop_codon:yes gene_type:complete
MTPDPTPESEPHPEPLNPFFRMTIASGALFVITILALIASALGPESSSMARATLEDNAGWLLGAEVLVLLVSAGFAMAGDGSSDDNQGTADTSTDDRHDEPERPTAD